MRLERVHPPQSFLSFSLLLCMHYSLYQGWNLNLGCLVLFTPTVTYSSWPWTLSRRRFSNRIQVEYAKEIKRAAADKAALIDRAVIYLGASSAKKMLLVMSPAAFPHAITTPEVSALALRFVIFPTVQAVPRGLVGYAYINTDCQYWC